MGFFNAMMREGCKNELFRNLIAYSKINKFLETKGICSPKKISENFKEGIMEIEDFGDKTLHDLSLIHI